MKNNRLEYEINDLALLHSWFEAGDNNSLDIQEIRYTLIQRVEGNDIWSNVIKVTSDCNVDQYRSVYAKSQKVRFKLKKENSGGWLYWLL